MILKNPVRTAKKTQHFTIAKIVWLTLFQEIIAVNSKNHTKHKITNEQLPIVQAGGKYNYRLFCKGLKQRDPWY
jgi:hypothetical protein